MYVTGTWFSIGAFRCSSATLRYRYSTHTCTQSEPMCTGYPIQSTMIVHQSAQHFVLVLFFSFILFLFVSALLWPWFAIVKFTNKTHKSNIKRVDSMFQHDYANVKWFLIAFKFRTFHLPWACMYVYMYKCTLHALVKNWNFHWAT